MLTAKRAAVVTGKTVITSTWHRIWLSAGSFSSNELVSAFQLHNRWRVSNKQLNDN
ncbi:hypothetical protein ROD_48811 [Citrobacter rodentium ICC168]|uniref:Uncharacterized protein n=1 Tax=Citrobacter rodentium (strain ICC168) TaxID=637910 RepID=D2TRX3_CITRI|nr:hypothetical protein ROD_48811 [Citrobacter rodentium ICC168]